MRDLVRRVGLLQLLVVVFMPLTAVSQNEQLSEPKVVLIGDSIRLSYASIVSKSLEGQATIISPAANGGDSRNVLKNIQLWAVQEQPEIIHFNCGIHDTKKSKNSEEFQVSPEQYETNLREIVSSIRAHTNAVILFSTTTPILDLEAGQTRAERDYELLNSSIVRYNKIAIGVMRSLEVPINDLYHVIADSDQSIRELIGSDGVHLTSHGQKLAGQSVSAFIRNHLGKATRSR
ncbi:MAG: SGNH/GDSL hydrolase family protein [Planctomycetales bacterium]|nr:SGNH/GDSL hydrolase family protein [Planctomycetales bacterium]